MCDSTLAIYCFSDDFLKTSGHRQDVRTTVLYILSFLSLCVLYVYFSFGRTIHKLIAASIR